MWESLQKEHGFIGKAIKSFEKVQKPGPLEEIDNEIRVSLEVEDIEEKFPIFDY